MSDDITPTHGIDLMKQPRIQSPVPVGGFTLIEVMVVVAIVAILASLAYAGYGNAMMRTRRSAAAGCVQESAQFMERFRTTNMTYDGAAPPGCSADVNRFYTLATESDATSFTVTATPNAGTSQTRDTRCEALSIDERGIRSVSGTAVDTPAECW